MHNHNTHSERNFFTNPLTRPSPFMRSIAAIHVVLYLIRVSIHMMLHVVRVPTLFIWRIIIFRHIGAYPLNAGLLLGG